MASRIGEEETWVTPIQGLRDKQGTGIGRETKKTKRGRDDETKIGRKYTVVRKGVGERVLFQNKKLECSHKTNKGNKTKGKKTGSNSKKGEESHSKLQEEDQGRIRNKWEHGSSTRKGEHQVGGKRDHGRNDKVSKDKPP